MSRWTVLALAVSLGMDALAVAATAGMALPRLTFRAMFRLSWHFGLFQFLMPVLGWQMGMAVQRRVAAYDHWVAFGLLAFIGGKMIYESFGIKTMGRRGDPTRGWRLVGLSVATSIVALAVGVTMAMAGASVWLPSIIIGLAAGLMTLLGMHLGRRLGGRFGSRMEVAGGLVLIVIGLKILAEGLG